MSRVRHPAVAGRFYPSDELGCERMLDEIVRPGDFTGSAVGAVVPHAGWIYSGATAALGINALASAQP